MRYFLIYYCDYNSNNVYNNKKIDFKKTTNKIIVDPLSQVLVLKFVLVRRTKSGSKRPTYTAIYRGELGAEILRHITPIRHYTGVILA
jgi:hypothetical protein